MPLVTDALGRLQEIAGLRISTGVPLAPYTRFGIGGPAALFAESASAESFALALAVVRESNLRHAVISCGTNLIVSDYGFDGIVLRFTGERLQLKGMRLTVEAGALLQTLVDTTIASNLQGIESMTGIPGSLGAAIYGNAGAYGTSIDKHIERVWFTDGATTSSLTGAECEFEYRGSVFKNRKEWIILSAVLSFRAGDRLELQKRATEIRTIRDAKYPPTMRCAGSIFKNCIFSKLPAHVQAEVPPSLVRHDKVPSAWFLEQIGAKGLTRGDIKVAGYHANLIYNDGDGTAADLVAVISDLKARVFDRFGFSIEEEVQYVGFD